MILTLYVIVFFNCSQMEKRLNFMSCHFADSSLPMLPYIETEATRSLCGMSQDYSGWCASLQ